MAKALKTRTAKALKWNVIDRISTQILYAVTGIILAREISQADFGLVGAILIFQSFALLFIDSGFSYALVQKKTPTDTDYTTVFWFNLACALLLFVILWFSAPFISSLFDGGEQLVWLSRAMFSTFVLSALSNVQISRLVKQMNIRPFAAVNFIAMTISGAIGIILALEGFGAWAIVLQAISLNLVKAVCFWWHSKWKPTFTFSLQSFKSCFKVGSGMMGTSFLNIVFQNIYSFFIGNHAGLVPLGYYTQSDKWSKMGITAVSQTITATFLPTLSEIQDDPQRRKRISRRINKLLAMAMCPTTVAAVFLAQPLFHVLFGTKWDPSVILFQILMIRGFFTVSIAALNNEMLALGKSRSIFRLELFRDAVALVGILVTIPLITLSSPDNIVEGITWFLLTQLIASALTWIVTLAVASRITAIKVRWYLADMMPGLALAAILYAVFAVITLTVSGDIPYLILGTLISAAVILPPVILNYKTGKIHNKNNAPADSQTI